MARDTIDDSPLDRPPAPPRSRRITVVTETYPPEVNGVAMSLARLVDGLRAREHDLQLVRPHQDERAQIESTVRFEQVLTGAWPIPQYPHLRMGVPSRRRLERLWAHRRPDVVHIATEGPLGWSALQAALRLRLPVTSDFRTNFHDYGRHYRLGWLAAPITTYLRAFHNRTRCTMVPTEPLRAQLASRGFERLAVVSRGVDVGLFDPQRRSESLRRHWGVDDRDLVVASVGRLAPEKNLHVVVESFERLRAVQPRARLLFVGDGPMRGELQARCRDAIFPGQRRGTDLAAHYASADLFLFPSLTETFGNVTVEAMASGLPVVAYDCAAAGQLIASGRNGRLVRAGDEAAFVDAVLALAGDADMRAAMGCAARAQARRFDWGSVVSRFEAVLADAIGPATALHDTTGIHPLGHAR